jgi:hypothetical protein
MASRIIEVRRAPNFIQDSNQDAEVQEYFGMAFKAIGSYWKEIGTVYATGLTKLEEEVLMPELLGNLDPVKEQREFKIKVQEFFKNINHKIPPEGMKLEIGLEGDGELLRKDDKGNVVRDSYGTPIVDCPPLRVMDYVRWKHIIGHPHVGLTKDEADRYQHKQFYILDRAADTTQKTKLRDKEDAAQREYLAINKDLSKAEMVLTLLGVNTKNMGSEALILELKSQATIDPDAADVVNVERLDRFIKVVNDKELAAKYDIMEMVRFGLLERIRTKVLIKESGETVGENLVEAADWLLDKRNSKLVNSLYAQLDALGKDRKIKHASPHLADPKKEVTTPLA